MEWEALMVVTVLGNIEQDTKYSCGHPVLEWLKHLQGRSEDFGEVLT